MWKLERHYLKPARNLLMLPMPEAGLDAEFVFAIGHLLLAVVAGVSTTLYSSKGGSGDRFQGVLVNYYPFALEPWRTAPKAAARTLWKLFRNSLAHDLGFDVEQHATTPEVKLIRSVKNARGLPEEMIAELEDSAARPQRGPTVEIRADATVLNVDALYWGVRCMVEKLVADPDRIQAAETYLTPLAKH